MHFMLLLHMGGGGRDCILHFTGKIEGGRKGACRRRDGRGLLGYRKCFAHRVATLSDVNKERSG